MKFDEMLENNTKVPGVYFKKGPNNIQLFLEQEDSHGKMIFYSLFPGIYLAYIKISSPAWPIYNSEEDYCMFLVNYCIHGRCELLLNNGNFIYLDQGDLALSNQAAQNQFTYPYNNYEGIEFYIDIKAVKEQAEFLSQYFEVDVSKIRKTYCYDDRTYIAKPTSRTRQLLENIWLLQKEPSVFHMRLLCIELFQTLLDQTTISRSKSCSFYTGIQVQMAKKVNAIISSDLRKHYPVRELAGLFSVSETSLKNYFRGVYGKNISVYLRELRMDSAAKLLVDSNLSVLEIAEQVGYANQGKFAAVFKKQFQITPSEYRRKKILEKIS